MHILAPIISGREAEDEYVEAITKGADNVTLLQIVDREFMSRTSAAMGEVMQFSTIMSALKKKVGQKKKPCTEITEWGTTTKKIISISLIQKVDKVIFVEQKTAFFKEITDELKKNKIEFESVVVPTKEEKEKAAREIEKAKKDKQNESTSGAKRSIWSRRK